ncbi:MAG: ParB/RepB/Spo0J family partition protein [SAR324 cluster bacterium]|nr:ParB/RepB/Spo0J family partition protein [SAR324 cluster bacterium]
MKIPLENILPNPKQPRKRFHEESIKGLAQSIRNQGIIQPLVVRRSKTMNGCFELIAGERRWRAIQMTDIKDVMCLIKEVSDQDLLEVALLENIQRENLTPVEEARCYEDLLNTHGYTQEQLANRIGKNRATIANAIRLLQLPSPILNDLEEGRLSSGHARPLLSLADEAEQLRMRELILRQEWSVRETEAKVRDRLHEFKTKATSARKLTRREIEVELLHQQEEWVQQLGTKVHLNFHQGQGSIKIEFYSLEEYERIRNLLFK